MADIYGEYVKQNAAKRRTTDGDDLLYPLFQDESEKRW